MAIADAYDSMTSDNHYRAALSPEDAKEELRRHAGTQFDPELVERFLSIVNHTPSTQNQRRATTSSELALSMGAQMESLVSALDSQDLKVIAGVAGRLRKVAVSQSATEISSKAEELEQSLDNDDDYVSSMQIASELLDLCRATQAALLHRNEQNACS